MKILEKIEWVLVDLDGTLVDSIEDLFHVYLDFLNDFGINGTKNEFESINGPNLKEMIQILKNNHKIKTSKTILYDKYFEKLKSPILLSVPSGESIFQ